MKVFGGENQIMSLAQIRSTCEQTLWVCLSFSFTLESFRSFHIHRSVSSGALNANRTPSAVGLFFLQRLTLKPPPTFRPRCCCCRVCLLPQPRHSFSRAHSPTLLKEQSPVSLWLFFTDLPSFPGLNVNGANQMASEWGEWRGWLRDSSPHGTAVSAANSMKTDNVIPVFIANWQGQMVCCGQWG